jgi:Super-infection exclusion protein B
MAWPGWAKPDTFLKLFEHRLLLFGIFAVCAIFWILPTSIANYLRVADFRELHRTAVSLVGGTAFVLWAVQLWPLFVRLARSKLRASKDRSQTLRNLETLSRDELFVLAFCLDRNQRTVALYPFGQRATALVQKGLLVPANYGTALEFNHTIPDFVWDELQRRRNEILPADTYELEAIKFEFDEFERLPRLRR